MFKTLQEAKAILGELLESAGVSDLDAIKAKLGEVGNLEAVKSDLAVAQAGLEAANKLNSEQAEAITALESEKVDLTEQVGKLTSDLEAANSEITSLKASAKTAGALAADIVAAQGGAPLVGISGSESPQSPKAGLSGMAPFMASVQIPD